MLADCPKCNGDGLVWRETYYLYCNECNGVGQIYTPPLRGSQLTERQYLLGAIVCAAVVVGLILMFASKL